MTNMFSNGSLGLALVAAIACGCQSTGGGKSADGRPGTPLELERLQVGSVYGIGSRFASDGLQFTVEGFGEGLGNAEIARAGPPPGASAPPKASKDDAPKTLLLSHATLRCRGRRADHLEFDFVDLGGPVALEIAGETRSAADFIALDGTLLGSVRIAVTESSTAGVRHGRMIVSGPIENFAIGGAALEVADLRLSGKD